MDKQMGKSKLRPLAIEGWDEVIRDAEVEIAVAEARIARLRRVIAAAKIQAESGIPLPSSYDEAVTD